MYYSECFLVLGIFTFLVWSLYSLYNSLRPRKDYSELRYLVVVVQNQELVIEGIVQEMLKFQHQLGDDTRLMIVDINSQDRTLKIIEKLAYPYNYFSCVQLKERQELDTFLEKYAKDDCLVMKFLSQDIGVIV